MSLQKGTRTVMRRVILCLLALWAALAAGCLPSAEPARNGEMTAVVARIIDGDTFETETGERVRMIGIDTPESVKPNHPVEPYGKEAAQFTRSLLEGQTVTLRFDVEPRDRYGRLLAYVYLPDGTFVNELIVREGYARIMTIPPNVAHADRFLAAEREARRHNRGLWGMEESEVRTAQPASAQPVPDPSRPIKGNINSRGEKIYHVPGSRDYEKTKAEVWFATVEEAEQAGFRAPRHP